MDTDNLWGEISQLELVQPGVILREQATKLGELTRNVLRARVRKAQDDTNVVHMLEVVADAVGGYVHRVAAVNHELLSPYPAVLTAFPTNVSYKCEDEAAFRTHLASVLKSNEVLTPVRMLLTLSVQGEPLEGA